MLENIIIIAVLLLIVGAAAWYVIRAKRQGQKCIGCPHGKSCSSKKEGCSHCNSDK